MSDLISRQAAIDALAEMYCKSDEDGYVWIVRSDAWSRIDALPSAQPEDKCSECDAWNKYKNYGYSRWIPVSERLPSIPVWYLVTAKSKRNGNNFVRILHYNGEKYGWEEQSTCTVLAWAEMPEPWKEVTE